ncbi:GNAT family N-acetyltransferase [Phenylobacterium montanum]|uniref:GNAT family N-acetyltransferase n=1 Tax=Phenylobacterium montanum TaxID=2823693 RepID=A0A975FYK1_9CAUL|nr:GNAT family N-acetyltransferase [Caulobacter sp. S6]QUD87655.1 GNAT family N-acetyltransferase [Caulobacter sp. S6]
MTVHLPPPVAARPARAFANDFEVRIARTLNDLMQVMAVRTLVYMGEQACPYDEEFDGNDFAGATHLILRKADEPVGVVRLRWFADFAKLERLSIRKEHRGGPGLMMLSREAFDLARRKGYRRLMGHAQLRVVPFWKRYFQGRVRDGRNPFSFSDYDYVELEFDLAPVADAITINSEPLVLLRPEGDWDRPGVIDRSVARSAPAAPI